VVPNCAIWRPTPRRTHLPVAAGIDRQTVIDKLTGFTAADGGVQPVRLARRPVDQMANLESVEEKRVGDQSPVASPPQSLGAQHDQPLPGPRLCLDLLERRPKRTRFHIARISPERGVRPCCMAIAFPEHPPAAKGIPAPLDRRGLVLPVRLPFDRGRIAGCGAIRGSAARLPLCSLQQRPAEWPGPRPISFHGRPSKRYAPVQLRR
jgi:hypothetical protein